MSRKVPYLVAGRDVTATAYPAAGLTATAYPAASRARASASLFASMAYSLAPAVGVSGPGVAADHGVESASLLYGAGELGGEP